MHTLLRLFNPEYGYQHAMESLVTASDAKKTAPSRGEQFPPYGRSTLGYSLGFFQELNLNRCLAVLRGWLGFNKLNTQGLILPSPRLVLVDGGPRRPTLNFVGIFYQIQVGHEYMK